MALGLGCNEAWKTVDGAADAAWHDQGFSVSPAVRFSSNISSNGTKVKAGHSFGGSRGSQRGEGCLSLTGFPDRDTGCVFLDVPPALILEIFTHLDARELCVVCCVCSLFRLLASDSRGWKDFYCDRWGLPASSGNEESDKILPGKHWRELYVAKESRSKAMMGRFSMDMLHGHSAAVRAVRLLPAANLVCTAGYDQTVRLWNLEEGLPVSCSRSLGETIRAIAVDTSILAVGGSDAAVRVWHVIPECPHLFDIAGLWNQTRGAEAVLRGHTGPVTCLGLDLSNLYSGSWDMSIRVWNRSDLKCSQSWRHVDWVWALAQRGRRVLSTAGSDVYSWDVETGKQLRVRMGVHSGQAYAVEGTRSGHIVFTGGEDGGVRMFDDRISRKKFSVTDLNDDISSQSLSGAKEAVASWTPHSSAVYSLAYDDPWLVSASGDGSLAMMDVRQIMKRTAGMVKHPVGSTGARWRWTGNYLVSKGGDTAQRRLTGFHQSAYSVDLGADRVVSAGDEKIIRIWDFSQALEIERMVQASRSSQLEHRGGRRRGQVSPDTGLSLENLKGKHVDNSFTSEDKDQGGRKGSRNVQGSGQRGRKMVPRESTEFSTLGTKDSSQLHAGQVGNFTRTRARYVDSVSVPS